MTEKIRLDVKVNSFVGRVVNDCNARFGDRRQLDINVPTKCR